MHRLIVLILFVPLSGCAAPLMAVATPALGLAAAEAGTSAYVAGELRIARFASLDETWQATHAALDELELDVQVERIGQRRYYVMVKDEGRGKPMAIRLDRRSPKMTRIGIRIGVLGEPSTSNLLVERIDWHLAAMGGEAEQGE